MESLEQGWDKLVEVTFEWLPQLVGAIVLILAGLFIAGVAKRALKKFLHGIDLDDHMANATGGDLIGKVIPSPVQALSLFAYWVVLLGFLALGASVLGIDMLNNLVYGLLSFIPDLLAAVVIFLAASALAAGAVSLIKNTMGGTPTGRLLEGLAPVIIVSIGIFMILDQLGIAENIVTITYVALVGSVAVASALAFGLGGREVAAKMLEESYRKARENKQQVKDDLAVGADRMRNKKRR